MKNTNVIKTMKFIFREEKYRIHKRGRGEGEERRYEFSVAHKILWDPPRWCENCDKDELCLLAFLFCFFFFLLLNLPSK